jgi:hypothetical protein
MTDAERQGALRRLFELCLWPIEYGASYDIDELARTLTPAEMEVLADELDAETWPTELDV